MARGLVIGIVVVVVVGIVTVLSSTFIVDQREQALVLRFGDPQRVVQEPGLKFKAPFVDNVVYFDKRLLDLDNPPEEIIAADQKRLVVDSFVRFRIVDPLLFYQTVRSELALRPRLAGAVNSELRRVLGQATLTAIVSEQRTDLMRQIRDSVRREADSFGIEVVDVRIKRSDLPQANSEAIYRRMQTERQREAAEFRARGAEQAQRIRAEAEKERTVIIADAEKQSETLRGEGDGVATKTFAAAFGRDPEFFDFYRSIQAYEAALTKDDTTMVLSPDSEFFRFFRDDGSAGIEAARNMEPSAPEPSADETAPAPPADGSPAAGADTGESQSEDAESQATAAGSAPPEMMPTSSSESSQPTTAQ